MVRNRLWLMGFCSCSCLENFSHELQRSFVRWWFSSSCSYWNCWHFSIGAFCDVRNYPNFSSIFSFRVLSVHLCYYWHLSAFDTWWTFLDSWDQQWNYWTCAFGKLFVGNDYVYVHRFWHPLRATCIGEATHPGPGRRMNLRIDASEDELENDLADTLVLVTQTVEAFEAQDDGEEDLFGEPVNADAFADVVMPTPVGTSFIVVNGEPLQNVPHFSNLSISVVATIDIDLYEVKPFSGTDGDNVDCFIDALLLRLQKLPEVGALPTFVYIPKSLCRRYTRQATIILKWWLKECDRHQPNQKHFQAANLLLLCFDFLLSRNDNGLDGLTKDHDNKDDLGPLKIIKSRLQKFEAGEWLVLIDEALRDIEKDRERAESRRIGCIGDDLDKEEEHKFEACVHKILSGDTRTGHRVLKSNGIHLANSETVDLMRRKFLASPENNTIGGWGDLREKAKKIKCPTVVASVLLKVISNTKDCKAAGCSGWRNSRLKMIASEPEGGYCGVVAASARSATEKG